MTDYFALLGEARRPWLDPEALKAKFIALSAETHPDHLQLPGATERMNANQRFADLNSAFNCLRDPKTRLQHLLELELGQKPGDLHQIPPDLASVFMDIANLCRQTDDYLRQKEGTRSPLLRARLFEQGQKWSERLIARQRQVTRRQESLLAQLRALDEAWLKAEDNTPSKQILLDPLQEIWRLLSFLTRWSSQIQERLARIAF